MVYEPHGAVIAESQNSSSDNFPAFLDAVENYREPLRHNFSAYSRASMKVHLVESNLSQRAQISHKLIALGFHAEIYSNIQELLDFAPSSGIILFNESVRPQGLAEVSEKIRQTLGEMPILVYSFKPSVAGAVEALKARAFDYLDLGDCDAKLVAAIDAARISADKNSERRNAIQHSIGLLQRLSQREHQVLSHLIEGLSNKEIARRLDLSPRTVEIHRMHMMAKLNAKTAAEAIGIWYAAKG